MQVRLEQAWTDADGNTHAAGELVDVDAATLAEMQAQGVVADWAGPTGDTDTKTDWAGPTGGGTGGETDWAGPTGGGETDWAGPTGPGT